MNKPSFSPESTSPRVTVGWREWLALPDLGVERLKVKIDTGARTSALHASEVEAFRRDGEPWVRFQVHPDQDDLQVVIRASAKQIDERLIRSSSGEESLRPVIETRVVLGMESWPIELTLVRRDLMGFRMLLGRQAMRGRILVDPGRSFLSGEPSLKR